MLRFCPVKSLKLNKTVRVTKIMQMPAPLRAAGVLRSSKQTWRPRFVLLYFAWHHWRHNLAYVRYEYATITASFSAW
jgi:hypothetical protein